MTTRQDNHDSQHIAQQTARMLLEIDAIHFNADTPYKLTSGMASPVYIDCRKLISYPRIRSALMDFAVQALAQKVGYQAFDAVAGGETAGIPFAAFIAERMNLPMLYVRKKPKGFGRNAQIEGDIPFSRLHTDGTALPPRVLLVEDLSTNGGSKLTFAKAMRDAGLDVQHCFVVFSYGIFKSAEQELVQQNLTLHALATWQEVLNECIAQQKFTPETLSSVQEFLNAPLDWSKSHGGI